MTHSPPPTPCTPPRDRRRSVPASRRLVLATLTHTLVSLPPPITALSCVVPPVPPPSSPHGSLKFVVLSRLLPSNRRIILSRSSRLIADLCSPHHRFISASWNGCERPWNKKHSFEKVFHYGFFDGEAEPQLLKGKEVSLFVDE
ncbi:hypothetical protein PIB30_080493 [Stylosanthes scabra]|uniref:Uncharacterized protein n=1 Tax=Stylosanthes scabra TaxID=79078 RepID=A0ABU6XRW0_9FABA|nr:hypothetical protein [Stylosanthes scabra]